MISKVFEHPFDLCKVRLQAQVLDSTARFAGPLDCLTQTWKYEGVRGLYRVCLFPYCNLFSKLQSYPSRIPSDCFCMLTILLCRVFRHP